jgi:DNA-binding MarR family transcriptional regulator
VHITRRPHPDDARCVECAIDVAGRRLVDEMTPELQVAYDDIERHLGPADARTLRQLLVKLARMQP